MKIHIVHVKNHENTIKIIYPKIVKIDPRGQKIDPWGSKIDPPGTPWGPPGTPWRLATANRDIMTTFWVRTWPDPTRFWPDLPKSMKNDEK